jgi:hypothetical protein
MPFDPRALGGTETLKARYTDPWRSTKAPFALVAIAVMAFTTWNCSRSGNADQRDRNTPSLVTRAQQFRAHIETGDFERARAMMAPKARRWWGVRQGEGEPWTVGSENGPWAAWDQRLRSQKEIVGWTEGPDSATVVVRETNDYFRLLERGWVTNEVTYYFDDANRIDGLLILGQGERPPGRTEEFLAWAKAHDPDELEALMPGGEIDPSGDHPQRFRRLLERWRMAAGLEPIE